VHTEWHDKSARLRLTLYANAQSHKAINSTLAEIGHHNLNGGIMLRKPLAALVLIALGQSALAQQPPTSGGQFQFIPPPPTPQAAPAEVRIERSDVPVLPASEQARIEVRSLRVTGQSLYSEAELIALTGFRPGSQLSITDLRAMAARIADHYRQNGYVVAQAYLPAQDIKEGAVTIAVIEGRYGNVTLRNQSTLSDGQVNGFLSGLNNGDVIAIEPLENRLLLLSDLPGINVKSTLAPGASVGASDLIVDVTPGKSISGNVEADNGGNRYTGEERIGATVNFNNPFGRGDVFSLRGMTSGPGLKYGRASYQAPVGRATVGVAYAALSYRLGREFASLQAHGTAQIASIYGSYPLIRSRNTNLYGLLNFDAKTFEDKVDTTATVTDKKAKVLSASLVGNHRDRLGGGGLSTGSLTLSSGEIDIITPAALAADQATAHSNGNFGKLGFTAARLQNVSERVSLYGSINGQIASKNLDISEKMGLGGPYAVRAYPVGEGYADEGYVVNLEARLLLAGLSDQLPGQVHLIGFADTGTVTLNKNPWVPGDNRRTLSGAGIGITWAEYNNFSVKAYWAHKLGSAVATSAPDENSRFWIQLVKYF